MSRLNFQVPPRAAAVTPSDATDLGGTVGFRVSGAGSVVIETEGGDVVTFATVPARTTIMVRLKRVLLTGTTATGIIRFFGI